MKVRNRLYYPVLIGLGLLTSLTLSTSVIAQDQANVEDDEVLEEVIVTGSRIVRDGYTSSSPLAVFDEQQIALAGNASIDEFLKSVPQFTGYQMGASTNNGSESGQKKIDMRGLGFNRTLVLFNGRRSIGDATGDGAVDLNTVPEGMIKRVEVLTDGASSIYGSDALAGVVNFIMQDDFEGFRVTGKWGSATEDWDATNTEVSILAGVASDSGNIVFSMSYFDQNELLQGDRDWAYDALYPALQPDGTFITVGSGSSNSRKIRVPGNGNWIWDSGLGAARPFESNDVYNYAPVNALTQPNTRYQFATVGKLALGDSVETFFEAFYTRRTSQQRLAPDASFAVISDQSTPNNGAQWNDWVPANNPYNPFGSVNCANSLGLCDLDVRINRRFEESGGRLFRQSNDNYRILWGLRGDIKDSVNWELSYIYAEDETVDETRNYGRFDRWATAVDPVACDNDPACPGVLDPFGEFGSISDEQMSYLTTGSLKDQIGANLQLISLSFNGDLFELSGGTTGWAAGYEHRRESGFYSPDEFLSEGLTTGGAADPLNGKFSVDEIYAEFFLPVLDNLSFDASFRVSDYDSLSDNAWTYKVGVDWEVISGLRLRSTYGTGFRAPNIAEINTQASGDFPLVNSNCEFGDRALAAGDITQTTWDNCQAEGFDTSDAGEYGFAWQSYYETSSPSELKAEESDTFTAGFVWTPDSIEGLSLSIDYWDIKVDNVIGRPRFNVLFNSCLASPNLSAPSCDPFVDGLNDGGGFPFDAYTEFGNLGKLTTNGVDFAVNYLTAFNNGLEFRAIWDTVWQRSYKEDFDLGGSIELVGTADGFGVYPEWRSNLDLGLSRNDWTADLVIRYLDKADDLWRSPATTADAVAESMVYFDLIGSYYYKNIRLTVGINNLTNEDPPYFHSAFNANTEPGVYDVLGRRLFTSVTVDF